MILFAKIDELQAGWKTLDGEEIAVAQTLIKRASAYIAKLLSDAQVVVDTSDEIQLINLETVTCNMVRRIMDAPSGVSSISQGIGSTNVSVSLSNPDMSLYLSKSDRLLLGLGKSKYRSIPAHTLADDCDDPSAYVGKPVNLKDVRFI